MKCDEINLCPEKFHLRFAPPTFTGNLSRCEKLGGGERDRTVDLRLAKPALSQLSYTPSFQYFGQSADHLEFGIQ